MPLSKPWQPLDRGTIGSVPDSFGVYELGDGDGTVVAIDAGVLRDELKEAIAYGDGAQVRWTATQNRREAERLLEDHRDRL